MRKSLIMAAAMIAAICAAPAYAEETTAGVTVQQDASSSTGYTATFVYYDDEASSVELGSPLFYFYKMDDLTMSNPYTPYTWENGTFSASASTKLYTDGFDIYYEELENIGDGYWSVTLPLPSGAYPYFFVVDGDRDSRLYDPANMPLYNEEKDFYGELSMLYVPYDAEKQEEEHDRSYLMPREDEYKGEIVFDTYTRSGETEYLAIYLPWDYDTGREEPYKTIYLAHGGGGSEMDWINNGSANNIMDNLIADGEIESAILVCMNIDNLSLDEIVNDLVPTIESKYHVSENAEDRAFGGLSKGGKLTSDLYFAYPTEFGCFGVMSASNIPEDFSVYENLDFPMVISAAGVWDPQCIYYEAMDNAMNNMTAFTQAMEDNGLECEFYIVPGAHDWSIWPQIFRLMALDFLR